MKHGGILFAGGLLLLGGAIAIAQSHKAPKPVTDEPKDDSTPIDVQTNNTNVISQTPSGASESFPLKKGSRGQLVRDLQNALNSYYGSRLTVDGVFGTMTETALKNAGAPTSVDKAMYSKILAGGKLTPGTRPTPTTGDSAFKPNTNIYTKGQQTGFYQKPDINTKVGHVQAFSYIGVFVKPATTRGWSVVKVLTPSKVITNNDRYTGSGTEYYMPTYMLTDKDLNS